MDARERLIEIGYECFVENGLDYSMAEIAKRANVSAGLPFYYFPTKKDYIAAMYESCYLERQSVLKVPEWVNNDNTEITASEYFDWGQANFWAMVNWNLENWTKFQFMELIEISSSFEDIKIREDSIAQEMEEFLSRGASSGITKDYISYGMPSDFIAGIEKAYVTFVSRYLYGHPELQDSEEFNRKVWLAYLSGSGMDSEATKTLEGLSDESSEQHSS